MSNSLPLNPFMSVRPRGKDMPSATPRGRARSKAPMQGGNSTSNKVDGQHRPIHRQRRIASSLPHRLSAFAAR